MSKSNTVMKNLNMKNKLVEVQRQKNAIIEQRNSVFNGEENADVVMANLKANNITIENINQLSNEEVDKILVVDGEPLELPEEHKGVDEYELKIALLKFILEAENTVTEMDKAEDEIDAILAESEAEFNKILEENGGSIIEVTRNEIIEQREKIKGNDKLEARHDVMLAAFDDSFTLNRVIKIYQELNKENTLRDMENNFQGVYKQYVSTCKKLGVKFNIAKYGGFEKRFLGEEYHRFENLFVFVLMRYISKRNINSNSTKYDDGIFISQLATNLYLLFTDQLEDKYKDKLITAAIRILDLFILPDFRYEK